MERSVLHVDMDAFYASIEQRDDKTIRGKPVIVGGSSNRGVVAAASYEARVFGIRSAMPTSEAIRRCPHIIQIKPRMTHYKSVSKAIFSVFRDFTPLVEGLSLDEAFLDVTASVKLFGSPENIAREIKRKIFETVGLTASVGIAQNKLVAKIASDLDKPNGLTIVDPEDYKTRLDPLPVSVIPGIGRETLKRLAAIRISSVRDLRTAADRTLEPIFGRYTHQTRDRASGIDARMVRADRKDKSISAEETYDTDLLDTASMERELLRLSERTAARLRKAKLDASTVNIKVRRADFSTFTRQQTVKPATSNTDQIYNIARQLLERWRTEYPDAAIRLLGVGTSHLATAQQADLFRDDAASQKPIVDSTVDDIRDKFGALAVGRARTLNRD